MRAVSTNWLRISSGISSARATLKSISASNTLGALANGMCGDPGRGPSTLYGRPRAAAAASAVEVLGIVLSVVISIPAHLLHIDLVQDRTEQARSCRGGAGPGF